MPVTYPPAPPTVDVNGVETISRFLNTPTLVQRALRTLAQQRFIGDFLLQDRAPVSGGAIQYEQNESIFASRTAGAVNPGSEFPESPVGTGPSQIASVTKWGLDVPVTDEAIRRMLRNPVDRAMQKLVNTVVKQVDTTALAAINAAVTQTQAATASWSTSATAKILLDLLTARATIAALNQGYDPDTAVVDDISYARLMADPTITSGIRREDASNPIYTGQFPMIAGLTIVTSPNLPTAGRAYVLDRKVLGGMADEVPLTSNSIREEKRERWLLRAKRVVVPYVVEPNAVVAITGV